MNGSISPVPRISILSPQTHHFPPPPKPREYEKISQIAQGDFSTRELPNTGPEEWPSIIETIPSNQDGNLIELQTEKLKEDVGRIEGIIRSAEKLDLGLPADISLRQVVEQHRTELLDTLFENSPDPTIEYSPIKTLGNISNITNLLDVTFKIFAKYFLDPAKDVAHLSEFPHSITGFLSEASSRVGAIRLGLDVLSFPFEGMEFLVRTFYLEAAKRELKELGAAGDPTPEMQKKIRSLKWFIEEQISNIQGLAVTIGIKTLSFVRPSMNLVLEIAKAPLPSPLVPVFPFIDAVVSLLTAGYKLHRAQKESTLLEKWVGNPKFKEPVFNKPGDEIAYVKDLYKKRQAIFEKRKEAKRAEFDALMEKVDSIKSLSGQKKLLLEANIAFKSAQKKWEEKTDQPVDAFTLKDKDFREFLFNYSVEHEDTISISTRENGLKFLSNLKPITEKKFFSFKLNKERILFALTLLASVAMIVLQILAWASVIAIPIAAQAVPGLGIALAGAMLFALGLYLFYRYKPNLFKTIVQGVQVRLVFTRIHNAFLEYRLKQKKIKQAAEAGKIDFIQSFILQSGRSLTQNGSVSEAKTNVPSQIKDILNRLSPSARKKMDKAESMEEQRRILIDDFNAYLLKQEKILSDIEALEKNVVHKKERIDALAERLRNAAAFDFAKNIGLETMKNPDGSAEEKAGPENMDIFKIIADGIIDGNWKFDEETIIILEKKMGIPITEYSKVKDPERLRQDLHKDLKDFFGMDASQLIAFFKKQNIQFNFS